MTANPAVDIAAALSGMPGPDTRPDDYAGAFPILSEAQITLLGSFGEERAVSRGETLFNEGDICRDFFLLLEGHATAFAEFGSAGQRVAAMFAPGQFLGELDLLTGHPAYVTATMLGEGRVMTVPVEGLRQVIAQNVELSELFLRAFLIRHALLMRLGLGLKVVGSPYNPDTRRILDYLARNRVPVALMDMEQDHRGEALLRDFGLAVADTPVVIAPGQPILRNPTNVELETAIEGPRQPTSVTDDAVYDLVVVGLDREGWPRQSTAARRA